MAHKTVPEIRPVLKSPDSKWCEFALTEHDRDRLLCEIGDMSAFFCQLLVILENSGSSACIEPNQYAAVLRPGTQQLGKLLNELDGILGKTGGAA